MMFYLGCGAAIGILITLLVWAVFKARIIRQEVERRIPELTEEYKLMEVRANEILAMNQVEIAKYRRIQAEVSVHAGNLVKALS